MEVAAQTQQQDNALPAANTSAQPSHRNEPRSESPENTTQNVSVRCVDAEGQTVEGAKVHLLQMTTPGHINCVFRQVQPSSTSMHSPNTGTILVLRSSAESRKLLTVVFLLLIRIFHHTMQHIFRSLAIGTLLLSVTSLDGADWSVPLAGNAFRTAPAPGGEGFRRGGLVAWNDPEGVFSVFFHLDRPADLELSMLASSREGRSMLLTCVGDNTFHTPIEGKELATHAIGHVHIDQAGYVRVDLKGEQRTSAVYAEIRDLLVSSSTEGLTVDYVKSNDGNMFYWGRRGPSVHLGYEVPRDLKLQYAYSEITVPQGQDPEGSYFMANGFGEGYFGIQVNGPDERRVLFSVWSPFATDNPRDIPEDQRIVTLAKGPEVRVGEFGNEGSGGQSFLVYPWKAGVTYRFLTEVKPDGEGNTVYTSWFGNKSEDQWRLIASFRRPQTNTSLRGFHSFLESFNPTTGYIQRSGLYGNVWVRDVAGGWHECTRGRFSVDATGGGGHRLDFTGGAEGTTFFLRNCGFFNETGHPGETFARESTAGEQPKIDFASLPRS